VAFGFVAQHVGKLATCRPLSLARRWRRRIFVSKKYSHTRKRMISGIDNDSKSICSLILKVRSMTLKLTSLHLDSLQLHSKVSTSRSPSLTTAHCPHQQSTSNAHHTLHLSLPPPNLLSRVMQSAVPITCKTPACRTSKSNLISSPAHAQLRHCIFPTFSQLSNV
jgi:hypothetical protein